MEKNDNKGIQHPSTGYQPTDKLDTSNPPRQSIITEAPVKSEGEPKEFSIDFIEWYSGMPTVKIRHAYERYRKEVLGEF